MIHLLEAPRSSSDFSRNSFAAKQRNDLLLCVYVAVELFVFVISFAIYICY